MRNCQQGMTTDDGFTLVELVAATAILLIVVVGAMSAMSFATQSALLSSRRVESISLANKQIELARNLPFDRVSTVVSTNGLPSGKIPNVQTIGLFTVTTSVAYATYNASTAARYKTMTVVVSWTNPAPGSTTMSTLIAGASGTQDYNFGIVTLKVNDEAGSPLSDVTVTMTDPNGATYDAVTPATGLVTFTYIPSGNITFVSTKAGFLVDAPIAPTCVANTTTNCGTVIAHPLRSVVLRCISKTGTAMPGVNLDLVSGPSNPAPQVSDSNGYTTFDGANALIKGTYTISNTDGYYNAAPSVVTIVNANITLDVTLSLDSSTVNASRSTNGKIYVWNADGTANTNGGSTSGKTASFTLQNTSITQTYYFTKTAVFATTNPLSVIAGQTHAVTVN